MSNFKARVTSAFLILAVWGLPVWFAVASSQEPQALPTPTEIADRLVDQLESKTALTVMSAQQVYYTEVDIKDVLKEAICIDAREAVRRNATKATSFVIRSDMYTDSFDVTMWHDLDRQKPAYTLHFAPDPVAHEPMVAESAWYPLLNASDDSGPYLVSQGAKAEYNRAPLEGIGEYKVNPGLLDPEMGSCATAEFMRTWIGKDRLAASQFHTLLAEAQSIELVSNYGPNQISAYHLTTLGYDKVDTDSDGSEWRATRYDDLWVDQTSGLIICWQTRRIDLNFGQTAAYLVENRTYEYKELTQPKQITRKEDWSK